MSGVLQEMFSKTRHEGRILYVTKVRHGRISVVSHKLADDPEKAKTLKKPPYTPDFPGYWSFFGGNLQHHPKLPEGMSLAGNTKLYHFDHTPEMDQELKAYQEAAELSTSGNVGSVTFLDEEAYNKLQEKLNEPAAEPTPALRELMSEHDDVAGDLNYALNP